MVRTTATSWSMLTLDHLLVALAVVHQHVQSRSDNVMKGPRTDRWDLIVLAIGAAIIVLLSIVVVGP